MQLLLGGTGRRDGGTGRVRPVARGGERSQGPAASISPAENVRLVSQGGSAGHGNPRAAKRFQSNKRPQVGEGPDKQTLCSRLTFTETESICPNEAKVNGLIHIIDLSLIHLDKLNTKDNYNGQTQQIQMNENRKGGGKHSDLEAESGALWKGRIPAQGPAARPCILKTATGYFQGDSPQRAGEEGAAGSRPAQALSGK